MKKLRGVWESMVRPSVQGRTGRTSSTIKHRPRLTLPCPSNTVTKEKLLWGLTEKGSDR
ncbi:hypothetical protein DY000_02047905 [Brassica cretica]|uniref:Uncharacterized protein n=1 Tax=Brassica cretica TaxID=69181 RepID=A0ABQ7F249_BRACR|nr:hypothetical protein DY000_02047905 [Brassica cretica]